MVAFLFAACSPYPRESERMAEAMAQAEAVYGDGSLLIETDTALFTICGESIVISRLTGSFFRLISQKSLKQPL